MKTIIEKIDKGLVGCLITPNVISSINSLIDVVTEQQKEIEFLKNWRIEHMDEHLNLKPYTAMRSTEELFVHVKPEKTYKAVIHIDKQQGDVREKVEKYLAHQPEFYLRAKRVIKCASEILAIVKGE